MGFGGYLRKKREDRGLTLVEVAERVGISVAYLSRIERERENAPKDALIQKVCKALDLDADEAFAAARRPAAGPAPTHDERGAALSPARQGRVRP